MSQQIDDKIKQIQEKLVLLARQHASVQKENEQLKKSLDEARAAAQQAAENATRAQQQLDISKYSNAGMNDDEKKVFEKKINAYIKEIDKAIALLSN